MADGEDRDSMWTSKHWVRLRKIVQILAFLIFLTSFLSLRETSIYFPTPGENWRTALAKLPLRLDPLAVLAHALASRQFLAGSALVLITILLTLVLGRVWCGWLCPLGTLLDWIPLRKRDDTRPLPSERWRSVKYILLITILIAAIFTNLTLLVLDPLTILYRSFSAAIWPALDHLVTAGERILYNVPFLQGLVGKMDILLRPNIIPSNPVFFRYSVLYGGIFLSILALNLAAPRFWCRYLCPLGAFWGLLSKVGLMKHKISAGCSECGICVDVCPTGAIQNKHDGITSDPSECTVCLDCLPECPSRAVSFPFGLSVSAWKPYDPGRREVLIGLGASILGIGLLGRSAISRRDHPRLIRPPGASGDDFLHECLRCGECVYACPTGAIQPALFEAGVEGLWTPVLVPRLGYCDYSCHACGQVCPVGAIPNLSLEKKREQVVGKAYINQDRCIAWADQEDCIVCEEMCPVPDKAILLEEVEIAGEGGERRTVRRPYIRRELCIGCGICEYKCPVAGSAAIRVYVTTA